MRSWPSGEAPAFQAVYAGSIPVLRFLTRAATIAIDLCIITQPECSRLCPMDHNMLYEIWILDPHTHARVHKIQHRVFAKSPGEAVYSVAKSYGFSQHPGQWRLQAIEVPEHELAD